MILGQNGQPNLRVGHLYFRKAQFEIGLAPRSSKARLPFSKVESKVLRAHARSFSDGLPFLRLKAKYHGLTPAALAKVAVLVRLKAKNYGLTPAALATVAVFLG